jgi:Putative phage serine protease XkdF
MQVEIDGVTYVPAEPAQALGTNLVGIDVVKATDERRYTLGVAYPAMRSDVSVAADKHIDFVSAEVLETTAWEWMTKHRDIGLFHRDGTEGHADVVESYIYRGPDWHIDGNSYVVKSGDWMLGTVWDEYGWQLVKNKLVRGWSPEGGARRTIPDAARLAQLRS